MPRDAPDNIEALAHRAGFFVPHDFGPDSHENYDQTMQHNAAKAFELFGAALPRMRDSGRIALASSLGFHRGVPDNDAHFMAKESIVGLIRALSRRVGNRAICVNVVAPGTIGTRMSDRLFELSGRDSLIATIPPGQLGRPEDAVGLVTFLLSRDASYFTRQMINFDGRIINA